MKFEKKPIVAEPAAERVGVGQYPVTMTFRCSVSDREIIQRHAKQVGMSASTYMRKRTTGGQIGPPIQDTKDISFLRQSFGLLKTLVRKRSEIRPTLEALDELISIMVDKVKGSGKHLTAGGSHEI